MKDEKGTITLYTAQTDAVVQALERDGVCFSREEYVKKKYEESSRIFTTAYSWFVSQAVSYVPRPEGAEYPYWVFAEKCRVDRSGGGHLLELRVPREEAVFFDLYDWNRILQLGYIGDTAEEEKAFCRDLEQRGIWESDAVLSAFYPEQKRQIMESWKKLFRFHEQIRDGRACGVRGVQAALWCLKKEWVQREVV